MLNIVLFGPPGAGKGTQSEKLIDEYQLVHLSTGDLLRAEVAAGTELGQEAKKLMDEGILVPDEMVIEMISAKLDQNKHAKGFIFDGFPRTTNQAKALDKLLAQKNTSITKMISLKVTDEELMERLLLRGKESGRPDDQDEDIIRNRIQEYNSKTAPLEDYYADQDKFEAIDGIGEISEIFYAISSVIKNAEIKEAFGNYDDDDTDNDEEEELVDSEGETESHRKQGDESFVSKVSHVVKVVKEVVSSKVRDMMHPEESQNGSDKTAKKAAKRKPAKKAPAKKAPAKKAPAKKAAPKKSSPKKATKKAAKKAAPKKSVKKVVKKAAKKVTKTVKKAAKKAAPKKSLKKSIKKVVKKVTKKAAKKVVAKKAAKKSTPKKAAKKSAPKKSAKKAASKKAAPKKVKKAAGKKSTAKKSGKKRR